MTYFLGAVIFLGGCDWLYTDNIGHQVYGAAVLLGAGGSTVLVTSLSMTADLIAENTVRSKNNNCCIGVTRPTIKLGLNLDIFILFLMKKEKMYENQGI